MNRDTNSRIAYKSWKGKISDAEDAGQAPLISNAQVACEAHCPKAPGPRKKGRSELDQDLGQFKIFS